MAMDCPVSLTAKRTPCPLDRSRMGRAPTTAPVFSICTTPPPPPLSRTHVLVAAHPYMFAPAAAAVRKNISPCAHVDGRTPPALKGLVDRAAVKSTPLDCVRRST